MIEVEALEGNHFRLDRAAIPAGDLAAVVAPTTACAREFVDLLFGLARPRGGAITVLGRALAGIGEDDLLALRAQLGFAAQAEGLVAHLALGENILLGAAYHHRASAESLDARVRTLVGWCGWTDEEAAEAFRVKPDRAGPFERAVAAWLRALLGAPELLVCEDLFGGLAEDQRRRLIGASVAFQAEDARRGSVFVLVGDRLLDELQPTQVIYLSRHGDFRAEAQA